MREANQWRNFGDYNLHNYLTLEQLDAVREAVPRVINTSYFVNAYMQARPALFTGSFSFCLWRGGAAGDICGICWRWQVMGSFAPRFRHHHRRCLPPLPCYPPAVFLKCIASNRIDVLRAEALPALGGGH